MEIIRLEKVDKIYKDHGIPVQALKEINLTIDKGNFVVIAGPSGSGKTTLLNIIGSLDVPTEGEVFLEGENITHRKKSELSTIRLRKIGFIFQAYNLLPVLTALENIEFSMMLLGLPDKERHKKAMKIMEELDIAELANKKPNKMSGGQQQRVAVARAIVNDPLLVLADEPTANLDSKTANSLLDLMQKMNEEKNITFVFSSHDKKVIDRAKKLFILKDGMIVNGNGS
ncbi:MAG: macrolide ABC transporter ATP-binding protein [Ignavibacteria bacterium GWB2_35_12]|nr:MAG: macrolide ABC transporter ATP-binding protein [Ignavibacteria bacterium GWA2_35_8]OGU42475.1 MAG: macrolide ABC transporter ATP-binding protein [Ignavibacteria bacterium GWB2_35_12]OGU89879.1 MAG: macrolide ABC transporter ATP-binding protein [Ignavibacteria bacterium RIFOXYA2_FULL_35_10]OGV24255.1 MAG: macrolide ABC transporter ATP-binding protein [Ignavibacteria bacterium RIFOXYC2_FULL_35_21]